MIYNILFGILVFYCGFKCGKIYALFILAKGVSRLPAESQKNFKKIIKELEGVGF